MAPSANAQVDAAELPEDVRDFIVKQRMCRHFTQQAARGDIQPTMARMICASGGDEAAWKALIRKYEGNDVVGSVLLAERPEPPLK